MSDHQSQQQAAVYNMASGGRPVDQNLMHPNNQLGVTVPAGAPIHNALYHTALPMRRQMPPYYPEQRFCFIPPLTEGNQVASSPAEYSTINLAQMAYQQLQYPQSNHIQQQHIQPQAVHQMYATFRQPPHSRPKRPLVICNPDTKTPINYQGEADSVSHEATPETTSVSVANETHIQTDLKPSHEMPELSPSKVSEENTDVDDQPESDVNEEEPHPVPAPEEAEAVNSETVETTEPIFNIPEIMAEEEADTTENETDEDNGLTRRVYDRDFLLSLKSSPMACKQLQQLADFFIDCRNRKITRPSHRHPPPRVIRIPSASVKRIEDAYVPSHLKKKEQTPEEVLSRSLNIILNRVTEDNLTTTIEEIKKLKYTSPQDIELLAKKVCQKGIRQVKYSPVFANMCKLLKGFEVAGSESFDALVLKQLQELFYTPLDTLIEKLNENIDARIANAKDESVKKMFEEDRDTTIAKETEAYYGCMTLLCELFLCRVVAPKTMQACLKHLKDSTAPETLKSLLILLKKCGQDMEQQFKSTVDGCFARLEQLSKSDKVATHQVFQIEDLINLRERNWKEMRNPASAAAQSSKRPSEMKVRFSGAPESDTRRKPPSNSITTSNLAVNHHPCDVRKLGPTVANWSQGSGQLTNSGEEKQRRSREASPRTSSGLGRWAEPLTAALAAQDSRPKEEYSTVLERNRPTARGVVDSLVNNNDDSYLDMFQIRPEADRGALLHATIDLIIQKKRKEREAGGIMCLKLFEKRILSKPNLLLGFDRFFQSCDEDWLEDYPFGWKYIAEILENLLQTTSDNFYLLKAIIKPLMDGQRAAIILAHCFNMVTERLGTSFTVNMCKTHKFEWTKMGVPENAVSSFVTKHSVSYTLYEADDESCSPQLNELLRLMESSECNGDQINAYFRRLSQNALKLPNNFIRSCIKFIIPKSPGFQSQKIDDCAIGLGILVDHNPDREVQLLQGLAESDSNKEKWLTSLVSMKVVSSEAVKNCCASSNCYGVKGRNPT